MSFRAVAWAFDRVRGLSATEKLVLLALAEFANDDDETWRSRESLAARAECSLSSVERAVRTLRTHGVLEVAGRYAWCGREDAACASRGSHKHRAGTTYHLRLDVAVDVREAASTPMSASTSVKLTGVGKALKSGGKVHTRQSDGRDATSVTQGVPHPSLVAGVLSKNPQLEPPTRPDLGVTAGSVESGDVISVPAVATPSGAAPHGTLADVEVVGECLPEHLRGLDASGLATVADLLRERLAAGWTAQSIHSLMDQPLPQRTTRLSGVVAYRLRRNVRPELAPVRPSRPARAVALERVVEPVEQAWDDLVWSPHYVAALGDTQEYLAAGKTASATIKARGLDKDAFRAAWQAVDDSLPAIERGRAALASLVAA